MIENINTIAHGWWNWMWPMFWQVSVLVVFLCAVDLLLRKHVWPQVRYALWLLVLLKLILPPTFSLSTSVISQARIKTDRIATQLIATNSRDEFTSIRLSSERNAYLTDIDTELLFGPEAIMTNVTKEPHMQTRSSDIAESDVNVKLRWPSYAMIVWFIVMVALSLWVLIRFRKLRKFHAGKSSSADLPQWFGPLLVQTAKKLGLRKLPEIALSRSISSPAVFGVFRPVLVLPAVANHRLSQKRTEHVLLHELAHIKRGDLFVNTFYMLLQIVYWFNPLLWLLRRQLQHLRELCCDATVARILRDKTVDYRETILEVTQRYLAKPVEPVIGLLGMTETSSRLLVRLKWLEKRTWKYRGMRLATVFVVVAIMSACVLPMAKAKNAGVLTVAADGSAKYSSIQDAIDAADEGTEIRIGPGVYEERLRINKPLTLAGAGWERTTIMTKNMAAQKFNTAMMKFSVRVADRLKQNNSKEQQMALMEEFTSEYGQEHATVLVTDTEGVTMRGIKFTSPGKILKGRLLPAPIIKFSGAKAKISDCAIIDSPGIGVEVAGDSDVEIRKCLVAAVWNSGILVKGEQSSPKTLISETDVRNCYHVGIVIRPGCDSTVVERCRISGAAWHGIRYDDSSPTIVGNRIFDNARCGIYASGQTAATVRQNLFYDNEMDGMSCWSQNRDTIEGNTFAGNERSGLEILGAAAPVVRKNIFSKNPTGVSRGNINSDSQSSQSAGEILLEENIFWDNPKAAENTTLGRANKLEVDPLFSDVDREEFSLKANSPARRAGIGASNPIPFESRWVLQPQEKAIIPDSDTRDSRQWKEPVLFESGRESQDKKPDVHTEATKAGTREGKQDFKQLLEQYKVQVAQLDKEMAAYRESMPVFAKFLDLVATEVPRLNQAREDAGARLAEARQSGVDLKSLKYDEKESEKIISGILAGTFGDIYSEFQKALDAEKLRLPDEQQTIYYRAGYFVTQSTEPLSGQWHEHSPYEQGTLEYCQFVNQLTYTASMLLSPLVKMAEQAPDELQAKQRRIDELYGQLVQLKRQSKGNMVLGPQYEDPYMKKLKASAEKRPGASRTSKVESTPVNPSDIALLYHSDPDVRMKTVKMLAESNDSGLIDDLIRAHSVENYTPVHNEYGRVLQSLTGNRNTRGKGAWKAWLASEAKAGRLEVEYLPIRPAADFQSEILAFALLEPDDFNEMVAALTAATYNRQKCHDALRYIVFNDHLPQVQKFLSGDWLSVVFTHQGISINDFGYYLNGLANPGPLRNQVDTQVSNCLDSDNPTVVANALNLIAGVEGYSTRFIVPDVEDRVEELISSSVPEITLQARRAMERIRPGEKRVALFRTGNSESTTRSVLQQLIESTPAGQTVKIPKGVYTEPVTIAKPLTLKGESVNECIFEVTANEPAIFVDTKGKGKVTIELLTIKWQLATSDRTERPFAVAVRDTKAEVKNCCFLPLGNFKRCPVAINSMGFSELNINACRFEGFEYTVCFGQGTKGTIRNSLVMDSGHQGISLYAGATAGIAGNVVTGSRYHAVRSTGGTLNMTDNLIINNANRGIYLGNRSARGAITNNVIIGNGTGIGGFARSNVKVENNIIADSSYAGIGMRDSCSLSIRDNIFLRNERGWILFKEGSRNDNTVYENTFWRNKVDAENMDKTADSIIADPGFVDADNGDFSLKPGLVLQQKQGLKNPEIFKKLWKIWKNRDDKNIPVVDN